MGLTPTFRDENPNFFLFRPLQRYANRSFHVAGNADEFRRKDGRWEDVEMNRTHLIACLAFCLVLLMGCAAPVAPHGVMRPLSTVPALAQVGSGVYIVVRSSEAHRNNVHAMAVNTTGISHATVAIRRGGRVFLQAGLTPGDSPAVIAMRGTGTNHSRDTDKRGDPHLAHSD